MAIQCGIYQIKNTITGKIYVGQSVDIQRRWYEHKSRVNEQNTNCYHKPLYASMRKYGIEAFEFSILELCLPDELNKKEAYYINKLNSVVPNGYNIIAVPEQHVATIEKCSKCGKPISKKTVNHLCRECYSKSTRKVERPTAKLLRQLLKEYNFSKVGKMFGVSDNAVRKWCIEYGMSTKAKDYK